jgi:DNA-binding XRE family transcriptional regulator
MARMSWRAVGNRLRVTRIVLGITEQEAAAGFGVTLKTYRNYEAGRPQRSGRSGRAFARKHNISLDWLYGGEGGVDR